MLTTEEKLSGKDPITYAQIQELCQNNYHRLLPSFTTNCVKCNRDFNENSRAPYKLDGCHHVVCGECLTSNSELHRCPIPTCSKSFDPRKKTRSVVAFGVNKMNYQMDVCQEHQLNFEWYCRNCRSVLCVKCKSDHRRCESNNTVLLAKYSAVKEKEITKKNNRVFENYSTYLEDKMKTVEKNEKTMKQDDEANLKVYEKWNQGFRDEIEAKLDSAISAVTSKIEMKHEEYKAIIEEKERELTKKQKTLDDLFNALETIEEEYQSISALNPDDGIIFLLQKKMEIKNLKEKVGTIKNERREFCVQANGNFVFKVVAKNASGESKAIERALQDALCVDHNKNYYIYDVNYKDHNAQILYKM